jgi:hypothetical protein
MHTHIKTLHTYETRDGVKFDSHAEAVSHEHDVAIPCRLALYILRRCERDLELSAAQAETIAHALLNEPQPILELISDFIEVKDAHAEYIKAAERENLRTRMLLALNTPQAPEAMGHA